MQLLSEQSYHPVAGVGETGNSGDITYDPVKSQYKTHYLIASEAITSESGVIYGQIYLLLACVSVIKFHVRQVY